MHYRTFFDDALQRLRTERRYRVFAELARDAARSPEADLHGEGGAVRPVTVWP